METSLIRETIKNPYDSRYQRVQSYDSRYQKQSSLTTGKMIFFRARNLGTSCDITIQDQTLHTSMKTSNQTSIHKQVSHNFKLEIKLVQFEVGQLYRYEARSGENTLLINLINPFPTAWVSSSPTQDVVLTSFNVSSLEIQDRQNINISIAHIFAIGAYRVNLFLIVFNLLWDYSFFDFIIVEDDKKT